jgi:hypothetical protein
MPSRGHVHDRFRRLLMLGFGLLLFLPFLAQLMWCLLNTWETYVVLSGLSAAAYLWRYGWPRRPFRVVHRGAIERLPYEPTLDQDEPSRDRRL